MYYGRSELILDFVINDMSIFGTSLRWNKPATMQFSHGSSYFHKHPRWQMDECLCRHGLNKQQRLPHCKLNLAVCTSGRDEVQVSSKIGERISADTLRPSWSHHHPQCPLSCSAHSSSMNVKLSLQTSSFVIGAVEIWSSLFPPALLWFQRYLGTGLHRVLAQSKHVLLWCPGLHTLQKRNVLICCWIPIWRHLLVFFLPRLFWVYFEKLWWGFCEIEARLSFTLFIALLPDSRHAAGLL